MIHHVQEPQSLRYLGYVTAAMIQTVAYHSYV